jgi:hypothetical protein
VLIAAALLLAAPAGIAPPAPSPRSCRWVRGRFNLWNGSSVRRIWILGTHRIVALRDADADLPEPVEQYLEQAPHYLRKRDGLFGDFRVCALEPLRPGLMQHVRLAAVRNLTFRGRRFATASAIR